MLEIIPGFETFKAAYDQGRGLPLYAKRIDDLETPVSALAKLGADRLGSCLFESVEGGETRGRYSIVACDPDLIYKVGTNGAAIAPVDEAGRIGAYQTLTAAPIDALRQLLTQSALDFPADLPPPAAGIFGYLAYETVRHVERIPATKPDPIDIPEAMLVRPRLVIVFDGVCQELYLVTPVRPHNGLDARAAYEKGRERLEKTWHILDGPSPLKVPSPQAKPSPLGSPTANMTPEAFMEKVQTAKEYIRAGDVFQVVPSQRFSAPYAGTAVSLYRSLRRTNPSPFLFLLRMDGFELIGSSPEILVRLRDGIVTMRPIAGTRPRGQTFELDQVMAEELLNDPKERAEHLMLLDLGRNDVGRVSRSKRRTYKADMGRNQAGVQVTENFKIERYSHVMHIVSNVEGCLKPGLDALDALLAGFPAGTVSGAPKIRAMEIIAELEPHGRGVYGGGIGYFSAGGDMDLCIGLRTGVLKDGILHAQAGAGVVLDSIPFNEHQECVHKAQALLRAAEDAGRYDQGDFQT
ncbi:anthranilate synthase component I [Candidatus Phycosocius spiralis]|uniref:Anthranilate synthase component 1 n=1 Tax=Candidatus Phycosocius spiralis TaxID=2815099 RepID=A0ABQ4PT33_9PROT|nr:anthranilate synthase component I [Candidatus Phycosocius spiralis]GIU66160.1 anthranilate synthase component I [Candidatus Phycosocius spiralis]